MNFQPQPYYTQAGLALECGISLRQVFNHTKAGTARLDKAVQRIPGVGLRYHGPTALKFIQIMQAKHGFKGQRGEEKKTPQNARDDSEG